MDEEQVSNCANAARSCPPSSPADEFAFVRQEYERFDVENDYDGEWIEDEFLYRSKRRKKAHTQDDAIYGVFADGSDDSDGGGRRRRRRGEDNYGAKPNYSKPVGFVGGGVIAHNGKQEEEPSEDEDDIDRPRGLGLGAGPSSEGLGFSGGGLGFRSAGLGAQPRQAEAEEGEDADEEFLPTAFGRRVAKQAAERRQKEQEEREGRGREGLGQRGGSAPQGGAARPAGDVGTFEAHTKGIGAKLLSKMGWTPGAGLGKEGKGIAKPLEAKLRPKGVGMGYGDRREAQMAPPPKKQDAKQAGAAGPKGAAAVDIRAEAKLWKRKNVEARGRRTFRTAEEILADEEVQGSRAAVERPMVIDMRGPQARVLTNLEHLNVRGEDEEEDSVAGEAMPELQHNVRLLVDIAEADIQRLDARLRQGQDTKAILERERERLAREAQTAAEASARLAEVLAAVSAARKAGEDPSTDSASLCAAYTALRSHHPDEYATYNLAALALAAVLPRLATALKHWAPLDDPDAPAAEFAAWRPLLEHEGRRHGGSLPMTSHGADFLSLSSSSDPYLRLVSEVVLPPLRKDIANRWDPRDAAAMERFMEVWEPLLPAPALGYVTHHLLLPRLRSDVGEWDPLKDPVAPHTWLHPWLVSAFVIFFVLHALTYANLNVAVCLDNATM